MKAVQAFVMIVMFCCIVVTADAAERKLQNKTDMITKQFLMIRSVDGKPVEKSVELWELNAVVARTIEDSLQSVILLSADISWDDVTRILPWFHKPIAAPTDKGNGVYRVEMNSRESSSSFELTIKFGPGMAEITDVSGKLYPVEKGKPPILYEVDRSLAPVKLPPLANPLR